MCRVFYGLLFSFHPLQYFSSLSFYFFLSSWEKREAKIIHRYFSLPLLHLLLSLSLHLCCASHYSLFSQEKVKCCKKKETIQSKVHTTAPPLPLKLIASFLQFYFYSFSLANKFILCTTVKKAATSVGRGYKGKIEDERYCWNCITNDDDDDDNNACFYHNAIMLYIMKKERITRKRRRWKGIVQVNNVRKFPWLYFFVFISSLAICSISVWYGQQK